MKMKKNKSSTQTKYAVEGANSSLVNYWSGITIEITKTPCYHVCHYKEETIDTIHGRVEEN